MKIEPYEAAVTHPSSEWTHTNQLGARTTLHVQHNVTMPVTTTRPIEAQSADAPREPKRRHPYPNRYALRIHEGDAGATEAETVLSYDEARHLHTMLGDALAWDGQ